MFVRPVRKGLSHLYHFHIYVIQMHESSPHFVATFVIIHGHRVLSTQLCHIYIIHMHKSFPQRFLDRSPRNIFTFITMIHVLAVLSPSHRHIFRSQFLNLCHLPEIVFEKAR